jgi:hypothetical protein
MAFETYWFAISANSGISEIQEIPDSRLGIISATLLLWGSFAAVIQGRKVLQFDDSATRRPAFFEKPIRFQTAQKFRNGA